MSSKPFIKKLAEAMNHRAVQTPYDLRNHTPKAFYEDIAQAAIEVVLAELVKDGGILDNYRDALFDMVWQYCSNSDGKLYHSFMSCEELAFSVLGIDLGMSFDQADDASKAALHAVADKLREG